MNLKRTMRCKRFAYKLLKLVSSDEHYFDKHASNCVIYENGNDWVAIIKVYNIYRNKFMIQEGPIVVQVYNYGAAVINTVRPSYRFIPNCSIAYGYGQEPVVRLI